MDGWLLQAFPGRTLDELDGMDWPRYLRARAAQNIESVEKSRRLRIQNKMKDEDLSTETWEAIRQHDQLIELQAQDEQ